jgi:hypothetical protein
MDEIEVEIGLDAYVCLPDKHGKAQPRPVTLHNAHVRLLRLLNVRDAHRKREIRITASCSFYLDIGCDARQYPDLQVLPQSHLQGRRCMDDVPCLPTTTRTAVNYYTS